MQPPTAQLGLHPTLGCRPVAAAGACPPSRPAAPCPLLLPAAAALRPLQGRTVLRRRGGAVVARVSEMKKKKRGGWFGSPAPDDDPPAAEEASPSKAAAADAAEEAAAAAGSTAVKERASSLGNKDGEAEGSLAAAAATKGPATDVEQLVLRSIDAETAAEAATAEDSATQQASAKLAVAARISAARALARKLAEEKQAAIAAARQVSQQVGDPETAKQMKEAAEAEVAELAKAAARADSLARAAKQAEMGATQMMEMQRLKAENEALSQLLLQLAANKEEAERRMEEVKCTFRSPRMASVDLEELTALEELAAVEEEVVDESAITKVLTDLAAAREALTKSASEVELRRLAMETSQAGSQVFTVPAPPVAVGSLCRIFYDRSKGPLPAASAKLVFKLLRVLGPRPAASAKLVFKVGLNKWESIQLLPMERMDTLKSVGDWWSVEFQLPEDLFRMDFVVMDEKSGAVDNHGGRDYQLTISGGPTEAELQLKRLAAYEAAEKLRLKELAAEEERLYQAAMAAAEAASDGAREEYRERKQQELLREAQAAVSERRGKAVSNLPVMAAKPNVFAWLNNGPEAGTNSTLVYNKASSTALRNASSVIVHVGYDGWWLKDKCVPRMEQDKRVLRMEKMGAERAAAAGLSPGGDWWSAAVPVWSTAAVLDFVFSDERQTGWDNGGGFDYHTLVVKAPTGEQLVRLVYDALAEAEADEVAKGEEAAVKRVLAKAHAKAMAARKRREMQARFLYTKPLTPVAGRPVDIFYNPALTVLNGRPEVYVRGSWNRWNHGAQFPPTPMTPTHKGGLGFLRATQEVPSDAHVMDLVFLDSSDSHGGFYDNNKGVDYHMPVIGGTGTLRNLKVVHIAVEMAPIAKAGGLGDVVTALGRAVQEEGHEVEVIMPKYDCIDYGQVKAIMPKYDCIDYGQFKDLRVAKDFWLSGTQVKVWKGCVEGLNTFFLQPCGLNTIFLEPCNGLFWQGAIYTNMNQDRHRFGFFCDAALEYLRHHSERQADILHCHDWQTAPIATSERGSAKCAFTIHNMNYGADLIGQAMTRADVCTTVSPTYAQEISGHPAIAPHHNKFYGIINGIDPDIWDPLEDKFLPRGYGADDVAAGKAAAKQELRKRMNL
ncbi:hypothetical protein N2152v2_000990, partial [Parachlorella kessleri]